MITPIGTTHSPSKQSDRCFVFSVTASHLHWAVAALEAVAEVEPDVDGLIYLVDVSITQLSSLNLPVPPRTRIHSGDVLGSAFAGCRRYLDGLELSGPGKVFGLRHALMVEGYRKAVFLDADTLAVGSFTDAWETLAESRTVLTPHTNSPYPDDGRAPDDLEIRTFGYINGGMWGVSQGDGAEGLLDWMAEKVIHYGFFLPEILGWAAEQSWMSGLPFVFPELTTVLRHPGYNVAYWNLHERRLAADAAGLTSNGLELVFLHLSGFRPENEQELTRFAVRPVSAENIAVLRPLLSRHAARIRSAKALLPQIVPDHPCSKETIGRRLAIYAEIHGRPNRAAAKIRAAAMGHLGERVLRRVSALVPRNR